MMTVQEILRRLKLTKKGTDPNLWCDVMTLLEQVTGLSNAQLLSDLSLSLSAEEFSAFSRLWLRLGRGEPVAYLVGWTSFYGYKLKVSPKTLRGALKVVGAAESSTVEAGKPLKMAPSAVGLKTRWMAEGSC